MKQGAKIVSIFIFLLLVSVATIAQKKNKYLDAKYSSELVGTWEDGKGIVMNIVQKEYPKEIEGDDNLYFEVTLDYYGWYEGKMRKNCFSPDNQTEMCRSSVVLTPFRMSDIKTIVKHEGTFEGSEKPLYYTGFVQTTDEEDMKIIKSDWQPTLKIFGKSSVTWDFDFKNGILRRSSIMTRDTLFTDYYPEKLVRTSMGEVPQKEPEYAIKIYNTPKNVKPDGESTVEITAILWEYLPGDENSNKRLAGKTINFVLDEYSEFKAGTLSATTAVTDANGQARVIFTAPTGERLQEAPSLKLSSTVNAVCGEFDVDDKAYISYILDDGKVMVEPTPAVISSEGLVPPDKRFPARIRAHFEDERLNSLANTKVRFWIDEVSPVGMLRGATGVEGTEVTMITDEHGFAEVEYYYAAEKQLIRPITESIKISSDQMAIPLEAKITVGMNIIFDLVENAYEGKGELNAGEKIPIRVKIKLAEYPNLDLSAYLNYWANNEETGDQLLVNLEINKISTVPTYLVQRLSLEDPPEPGFSENMTVRSFKDKGELNYLWVPYSSLEGYVGYPKISPQTIGTHYYKAHLSLTDQNGEDIYEADHPARTAFFNIETGMSDDLGQIFFLSNPFKQYSKEDQLCAAALGVMGMGTFLSVNDALHMINTGDVDGLFSILFSEVKGGILDKVKVGDAYKELAVDLYTGMALAENVGLTIMKDQTGPITAFEGVIFDQLKSAFEWEPNQVVIITGYGDQKLYAVNGPSEEEKNAGKSNFAIAVGAVADDPEEKNTHPPDREIPTTEGDYLYDEELNTTSLKNKYTSVYIIPADMKVRAEKALEMKRY